MSSGAKVGLIVGATILGLLLLVGVAALFLGSDSTSSSFEETGTAIGGDDDDDASGDEAPAVVLPAGYHAVDGDGVSMGVPEGWDDASPEDFAMSADDFREAFPDAPDELLEQGAAAVENGQVLVAFDYAGGELDNVNVLEMRVALPLEMIEAQARSELGAVGAEVDSIEDADVPAGEALRADYALQMAGPDGPVDVVGVQYYVVNDDGAYIVTFTGEGAVDHAVAMMETFRTS
jgi:hypothetical protein